MSSEPLTASLANREQARVSRRAQVAILGGGPAGLGAAWQLVTRNRADAIVLEQRAEVGGNAGSFNLDGVVVDYGSHRLHPACQPEILSDLRTMLGPDLLDRPRHGRIRLRGHWLHFPLKPIDLLRRLPLSFSLGVSRDALHKLRSTARFTGAETFASVLERNLGVTICREFYFPYAKKIWGIAPDQLSDTQAYRRVSAGSLARMVRKALGQLPGFKAPGAGRFYYPRGGYGQISRALADAALTGGAKILTGTTVKWVHLGNPHRIEIESEGVQQTIEADYIWSTIPITALARLVRPEAPQAVVEASRGIDYRAMILIYLVIGQAQFTPFDAHYFPDAEVGLTRLSEPKNYSGAQDPKDRTVLCCELPCDVGDRLWKLSNDELADFALKALEESGLPVHSPVLQVVTRRLSHAYPIYRQGYEKHFAELDRWAASLDRVLTFGRQGLFAHDNTHHALAMAYAAVDCLHDSETFDSTGWSNYRAEFAKHTVED